MLKYQAKVSASDTYWSFSHHWSCLALYIFKSFCLLGTKTSCL